MIKKFIFTSTFIFLIGIIFSIASSPVSAGSCTYSGSNGGNWSTGGNWSGTCVGSGGAPGANDDVTIPANISTTNNIVGLTLNSLTFSGSPSSTLPGNNLTIVDSINNTGSPNPVTIEVDIILGGSPVSLSTNNYIGTIDLNGNDLVAAPTVLPWSLGEITGSGDIIMTDAGTVTFTEEAPGYSGTFRASGNTVLGLNSSGFLDTDVVLTNGATLYGNGSNVNSVTGDGTTTIAPYNIDTDSTQFMSIGNGGVDLEAGDTLSMVINGTGFSDSDSITSGFIDIDGTTLLIDLNFVPSNGDTFTLITSLEVIGVFDGLPDGSTFQVNSTTFEITYTSTSVRITAAAAPPTVTNSSFTVNPENPVAGQPVVITSIWSGGVGDPTPTGTAELFDGATSLGITNLVGGVATFNIDFFTAGSHTLTVLYYGDFTYGFDGTVSDPLILNVSATLADTGITIPFNLLILSALISLTLIIASQVNNKRIYALSKKD